MKEEFKDFNWKEIKQDKEEFWDFKTMPLLSGRLQDRIPNKYDKHDYVIQTFDGTLVKILGKTMIETALSSVALLTPVCIEYKTSKDIGKGNDLEIFKVSLGEPKK